MNLSNKRVLVAGSDGFLSWLIKMRFCFLLHLRNWLSFEKSNQKYLMGFKLNTDFIDDVLVDSSLPWDINLKDYFQFEK